MTHAVTLTQDQETLLEREALSRGVDREFLIQQLLGQALNNIGSPVAILPRKRVLGLHAGQTWIADDFDAPLPDSFWHAR